MGKFIVGVMITVIAFCTAQVAMVLGVHAAPPAEYWVGESLRVKLEFAKAQSSPRVIFLGGSTTLFSVDAARVEEALGRPAMNFGLSAGMRLDRLFMIARETARPGDLIVLALEPNYYPCQSPKWSSWNVRNGIAWDRETYFDRQPLATRLTAALTAADPSLLIDMAMAWVGERADAGVVRARLETMQPTRIRQDIATARQGAVASAFAYSPRNMNAHGDMQNIDASRYFGPSTTVAAPGEICAGVLDVLSAFNLEMMREGVSVAVTHTPYLVEGAAENWVDAERAFLSGLASIDVPVLDERQDLFFARADFFDTPVHLNAAARERRTERLIQAISKRWPGASIQR